MDLSLFYCYRLGEDINNIALRTNMSVWEQPWPMREQGVIEDKLPLKSMK